MPGDIAHPPEPSAPAPSKLIRYAELAVAVAVIALGIVVLLETQDIRVTRAVAQAGPRVIPRIVGVGLIAVGVWYAFEILRGRVAVIGGDSEDIDPTLPADWRAIAGIAVALGVFAAAMESAGFVIAAALLFVLSAFSMGSRFWARDIACGVVLAVGAYLAFNNGLGVRLPAGVLDGVLP